MRDTFDGEHVNFAIDYNIKKICACMCVHNSFIKIKSYFINLII